MGRKSKLKQRKEVALTEKYLDFLNEMLPQITKSSPLYYLSDGGMKLSALLSAAEILSPSFPHLEFSMIDRTCLLVEEKKDETAQAPFVFA